MSALVLGKRSSCFFEELHQSISTGAAAAAASATSPQPTGSKRARLGASPARLSPSRSAASSDAPIASVVHGRGGTIGSSTNLGHLRSLFPDMDDQLLERALVASGNDLDSAIRSLNDLRLGSTERNLHFVANISAEDISTGSQPPVEVIAGNAGGGTTASDTQAADNVPVDGADWVELLVREMMTATDVNDARARAANILEVFEKSIMARAGAGAAEAFHKENMMLKEHIEVLLRDNNILKRAVAIQHERHKELDEKDQEVQHLKQLVAQYQEQIRTLEINNYALSMHLKQAQQSNSIPGRFHPDVF